jgi:CubicO group peptidase (beta-lactamase class C family)
MQRYSPRCWKSDGIKMNRQRWNRKILVTLGLILLWTLAVVAVVFAEAFWFPQPAVQRGDFASIENHLVQKLREVTASKKLGSAALVLVQGSKIVAEHGFGVANVETRAPVKTDQTLFILGSVSKAVTAWGVMKLVQEGKLGLDEPVMRYLKRWRFPGSEAYRDKVTVRHLMSHTAGIDDGFRAASFALGEPVQTLEESLTHPKDMDGGTRPGVLLVREPGTVMSYSASAGNSILQLLIEEVTHRRFADYMKESVLQPLGMTKSSYDLDAITAEGRAQDLAPSFDGSLNPHPPRHYTAQAAVALRVTPRDLAQFVLAYTRENPVLKPETLKQMMTPQPGTAGTWGLGQTLYVENSAGGYVVGHSGAAFPAQGASMRVNPATGNGFVLTASGGRGATNQLVHDWVYWETGKVTFEARRELVYVRLVPASITIIVGVCLLLLWQLFRNINKRAKS